jgi:hypothetical protein
LDLNVSARQRVDPATLAYLEQLRVQIEQHVFATEQEVEAATLTAERAMPGASLNSAVEQLEALWTDLEGRVQMRVIAEHSALGPEPWDRLLLEIRGAEERWQRLASVQFWIGLLTTPVIAVFVVAIVLASNTTADAARATLLAFVLAVVFFHSFFVLRIHQQARQAAERLTEKRVGIFFLRLAFERPVPDTTADRLVESGTRMFLGHQASASVPLSPEDLGAARLPGS